MLRLFAIALISLIVASGCVSSKKLYLRGHYDAAIRKSVKKLRANPSKVKHVKILEDCYKAANDKNNSRIKFLKTEGRPDIWDEIFSNYSQLKSRQELVKTVLPLNDGARVVDFPTIDYDREIIEAKKNAAAYFYAHAKKILESNNRFTARDAFYEFKKVKEYYPSYEDVDKFIEQARQAGITNVLLAFENNTIIKLPEEFGASLLDFNTSLLNGEWVRVSNKNTLQSYHNIIKVNLKIIDISPEKLKEKETTQTKTIQDGWEYKLDANNNTIKDSLGNPLKIPRMVTISCKVLEILQQKASHLEGAVEYYDIQNQALLSSKPIASDFFFENKAVTANGDFRALDTETAKLVGKPPVPFPNNIEMIMGATDVFKKVLIDLLKDNKYIIK